MHQLHRSCVIRTRCTLSLQTLKFRWASTHAGYHSQGSEHGSFGHHQSCVASPLQIYHLQANSEIPEERREPGGSGEHATLLTKTSAAEVKNASSSFQACTSLSFKCHPGSGAGWQAANMCGRYLRKIEEFSNATAFSCCVG